MTWLVETPKNSMEVCHGWLGHLQIVWKSDTSNTHTTQHNTDTLCGRRLARKASVAAKRKHASRAEYPGSHTTTRGRRRNFSAPLGTLGLPLGETRAMANGKSTAKMGQNGSLWTHTHTRRPIRRGKKTEMLIFFARNNKICLS